MKFRFVFWDALLSKIIVDRRFRGMMMEAARTSGTSVYNYFTRQYIPEDKSELQVTGCHYTDYFCIISDNVRRKSLGPSNARLVRQPLKQWRALIRVNNYAIWHQLRFEVMKYPDSISRLPSTRWLRKVCPQRNRCVCDYNMELRNYNKLLNKWFLRAKCHSWRQRCCGYSKINSDINIC
jgi:hypothetical protein